MRTLLRLKDWLFSSLAIIWIPVLLIIMAGLLWMIFGACTTDRCIASQFFMEQLIRQMRSGK